MKFPIAKVPSDLTQRQQLWLQRSSNISVDFRQNRVLRVTSLVVKLEHWFL